MRRNQQENESLMNSATIVQKLWNYCNVLRDDGMSYGDYVEQLTFLLFLRIADERSKPPYNQPSPIPKEAAWLTLTARDGVADGLFLHCIVAPQSKNSRARFFGRSG
jgi:type I restriction enzyme M protein